MYVHAFLFNSTMLTLDAIDKFFPNLQMQVGCPKKRFICPQQSLKLFTCLRLILAHVERYVCPGADSCGNRGDPEPQLGTVLFLFDACHWKFQCTSGAFLNGGLDSSGWRRPMFNLNQQIAIGAKINKSNQWVWLMWLIPPFFPSGSILRPALVMSVGRRLMGLITSHTSIIPKREGDVTYAK